MALQSERKIECRRSGQTFIFSDDGNTPDGRVKVLRYSLNPGCSVPRHSHPRTSQTFKVLSGELTVRTGGRKLILRSGDGTLTGLGDEHSQWNAGDEVVHVIEGYEPPLDIEPFFTALSYAEESRNILKFSVFLLDFSNVVSTRSLLGKSIIWLFANLGRMLGYGDWYLPHISHLTDASGSNPRC